MNYVKIKLDKERNLKINFNALEEIDHEMKIKYNSAFQQSIVMFNAYGSNASFLKMWLFHGLKWEDPKLTKESLGDIITKALEEKKTTLPTLLEACLDSAHACGVLPDPETEEPQEEAAEEQDPKK